MGYPAFIEQLRAPAHRPKLWLGVWSGYLMVAAFMGLAVAAQTLELLPWTSAFYVLIALKLATNTVAAFGLRADRLVMETQGLNTLADVLLMTGAVYFSGGQVSPLFPIYVIELSVVALLSNLGVTVMTSGIIWVSYCAMAILTHLHVLPQQPAPAITGVAVTNAYLGTHVVFAAFVIGVPTLYISLILRSLAVKRRQLEAQNVALVDAGRDKTQFMANVTHELRTPIHGIFGLTELLDGEVYGPLTDKQRRAVESIRRSAASQLELVDQLLQLAKAEVGKIALRPEEVDTRALVDGVASAVQSMLGTKQLSLVVDVADDPPRLVTDRVLLAQCLLNLMSNAAKFTPAGGRVELRVRSAGKRVVFRVSDTGPGIAPRDHERVFEAFRQLDGTDERGYGGVGLGLSLTRRLVHELGGDIVLESALGAGASFTVSLPWQYAGSDDELPAGPPGLVP